MTTRTAVRRSGLVLVVAGVASIVSACGLLGMGDGGAMQGDWVLVEAEDAEGSFDLTAADVTLSVDGSSISGTAACNLYGATVVGRIDYSDELPVRVDGLFQTEMACLDEKLMQVEARYLRALGAVEAGLRIDSDTMALFSDDVRLVFDLVIDG